MLFPSVMPLPLSVLSVWAAAAAVVVVTLLDMAFDVVLLQAVLEVLELPLLLTRDLGSLHSEGSGGMSMEFSSGLLQSLLFFSRSDLLLECWVAFNASMLYCR